MNNKDMKGKKKSKDKKELGLIGGLIILISSLMLMAFLTMLATLTENIYFIFPTLGTGLILIYILGERSLFWGALVGGAAAGVMYVLWILANIVVGLL